MSLSFNDRLLSVQWRYACSSDTGARYYFMPDNWIAIYVHDKLTHVNVRIKTVYLEVTERYPILPKKNFAGTKVRLRSIWHVFTWVKEQNDAKIIEKWIHAAIRCAKSKLMLVLGQRQSLITMVYFDVRETRLVLQDHEWCFVVL